MAKDEKRKYGYTPNVRNPVVSKEGKTLYQPKVANLMILDALAAGRGIKSSIKNLLKRKKKQAGESPYSVRSQALSGGLRQAAVSEKKIQKMRSK